MQQYSAGIQIYVEVKFALDLHEQPFSSTSTPALALTPHVTILIFFRRASLFVQRSTRRAHLLASVIDTVIDL